MKLVGRLVETGRGACVEVEGGLVRDVRSQDETGEVWIAAGLVDLQVNGYGGSDVNDPAMSADTVVDLAAKQWRAGVTSFFPTVISATEEDITGRLRAISAARQSDPAVARAIPGIHVEGPYLSAQDGPRGVHPAGVLRDPSIEELSRWQRAADGLVRIVTLAPELPGAMDYIRAAALRGVVAAIGHTACDPEDIVRAADAGARLSTHLGNGAHAVLPRHPSYLWSQLSEDRLVASFVADGHHLSGATLKAMLRSKTVGRSVLVSDSTSLAGMPPGRYRTAVGGDVALTPEGRLTSVGTPYLAGSAASLLDCVCGATRHGDVTLAESVQMASLNPRALLGLDGGRVRVGAPADLSVFRWHRDSGTADPVLTVLGGSVVHDDGSGAATR